MKSIIVIDMQKGFINKNNVHLIDKINNHLKSNHFDYIFYTIFKNTDNSPFQKILHYKRMINKDEQKLVVNILPNSIMLEKQSYGLTEDGLSMIKNHDITEIELCGTDTDACVMAIAYNLFDHNIKPVIKKELCASSAMDSSIHNNSLAIMTRSFGKENIV